MKIDSIYFPFIIACPAHIRSQSIDDGGGGGSGVGGGNSVVNVGGTKAKGGRSSKKRGAANIVESQASHIDNKFEAGLVGPGAAQAANAISPTPLANSNTNSMHGTVTSGSGGGGNPGSILSQQLQQQQQHQTVAPQQQQAQSQALQHQPKIRRTPTIEQSPPSTSRTPEVIYTSSSSSGFSGLKFGYEAQTPSGVASNLTMQPITIATVQTAAQIKDSPPSSPNSEAGGSSKKRLKKQHLSGGGVGPPLATTPTDSKDSKLFQNGIHHAAHMLGNQLNPASSMGLKLTDTLNQEIEAHMANTIPEPTPHVGPLFPGKSQQVSSRLFYSLPHPLRPPVPPLFSFFSSLLLKPF